MEEDKEEKEFEFSTRVASDYTWNRKLDSSDVKLEQFQVRITKGLKLMPLGVRMAKYVAKIRKEGKEPYMDPFIDETIKSNTGVPCGGLGTGSITRTWKGEFNNFFLHPGRPQKEAVKGNQFSIYIKREGIPSRAFVLGCPYKENIQVEEEGTYEMPTVEPLPDDIESFLNNIPDEVDLNSSNDSLDDSSNNNSLPNSSNNYLNNNDNKKKNLATKKISHSKTKSLGKVKRTTFITPSKALGDWNWKEMNGEYNALFPRAWTDYDLSNIDKKLKITCKQISPIIPHNYRESSFPVTVFVWEITNEHPTKSVDVSLMFTFQNGEGRGSDYTGGHYNQPFDCNSSNFEDLKTIGVEMVHRNRVKVHLPDSKQKKETYEDPLSFGIATMQPELSNKNNQDRNKMDAAITFETTGRGKEIWKCFSTTGRACLQQPYMKAHSEKGIGIGSALSNYVHLEASSSATVVFSLAWDQPIVRFGSGRAFYLRYTRFYGIDGRAVQNISRDALLSWRLWDKMIDDWQMPILNNPLLPKEYKCALFNELYFMVAGGSLWVDREESIGDREKNKIDLNQPVVLKVRKNIMKDKANKILEDFIFLTQKLREGMMVCDGALQNTGRIIFSLNELDMEKVYYTFNGNTLIHHKNGQVLLDTIILRSPSHPDLNNDININEFESIIIEENNNNNSNYNLNNSSNANLNNNSNYNLNNSSNNNLKNSNVNLNNSSNVNLNNNSNYNLNNNSNNNNNASNNKINNNNEKASNKFHYSPVISNEYGQFIYLEGQEYLMYNTYDVHFYASFALILLWPQLELNLQRDIARCAYIHSPNDYIHTLHNGEFKPRKLRGAIPHDIGTPSDDPFYLINSYNIHDVNNWKDLNSKFTLQVFRDFVATRDVNFLKDMWPSVWECMHFLERYIFCYFFSLINYLLKL